MNRRPSVRKDAYGQEMWFYLLGKKSFEIVERNDGLFDLSTGAKAYFAKFKDWPRSQKDGIRAARGRVLDIGAGAGRVSLYLQKKGLHVTAIDNSPIAIKVCRKRGVKDAKVMSIDGIRAFKTGSFDSVVMYGNNF